MNTARYVVGVLLVASLPPGVLLWFAIHPWVRFWRRLGAVWTYVVLSPLVIAWMVGAVVWRDGLLGPDLGYHPWLLLPVAFCAAIGTSVALKRRRHLTAGVLAGLPELSPDKRPGRLLTDGIYGRIRHPRYVEVLLFTVAYAFFANYVGTYVTAALTVPALYLTVILEERELRDRFGAEFEAYSRRVPRFIPIRDRRSAP
jgi:protein-S-isoprenylcysteine O-methyltransferase Ste14